MIEARSSSTTIRGDGSSVSEVCLFCSSLGNSLRCNSFASSFPFRFIVGPQKKTFYAHANLVAQSSDSMNALVNGPMKDASQKCATLEDFDGDTIVRFIEFLYTKDYTVADPDIIQIPSDMYETGESTREKESDQSEVVAESVTEPDIVFPSKKRERKKKKNKRLENDPWQEDVLEVPAEPCPPPAEVFDFDEAEQPLKSKKHLAWMAFRKKAYVRDQKTWVPPPDPESLEDYTQVFLCHARLYVFSNKYGIEPLAKLSLQKLRLTLSRFILYETRIPDLVELVRYTYSHTMELDQGIDKLRGLVMDYVICNLEHFAEDRNFQEILQEAGALAKDLVLKMIQRLD